MLYCSIDLETTGRNPERHQVLEMAAIVENSECQLPLDELPTFHAYVLWHEVVGEPYALAMNQQILWKIANFAADPDIVIYTPDGLMPAFAEFLHRTGQLGKVVAAGKNFAGFDHQFLKRLPNADAVKFHHRALDPAAYFIRREDTEPPGLETCLRRAGFEHSVKHTPVEDAQDVIRLLRTALPLASGK